MKSIRKYEHVVTHHHLGQPLRLTGSPTISIPKACKNNMRVIKNN